jgi:glycerophosphoryl diester phosphodiesterase
MTVPPLFPIPRREGRPCVLGHRGAAADAPENTLAAFREALRQGADGVELDVMVCGSGQLVVCHDEWLDRLAGVHLEVRATNWSRLRRLDLGARFSARFRGERMPLLSEALEALPSGTVVNVELKCEGSRDRRLAARAAAELMPHAERLSLWVSSFNPLVLASFGELAPRLPRGMLVSADQSLALWDLATAVLGARSIHPEHAMVTGERMHLWKKWRRAVAAWTVDEPEDVRRCASLGVDALITNRPGAALAALQQAG